MKFNCPLNSNAFCDCTLKKVISLETVKLSLILTSSKLAWPQNKFFFLGRADFADRQFECCPKNLNNEDCIPIV